MTHKEFDDLKIGDRFYLSGDPESPNEINMWAVYEYVGDKTYHNVEVVFGCKSTTGNEFCNFKLVNTHDCLKRIKLINEKDYPEYYI